MDEDLVERCLDLHRTAVRALHERGAPAWYEVELSVAQLKALFTLVDAGSMPIGGVAARLGIGLPAASSLVDRLVDQGLVERREDPMDRRRTLAEPTAAGEALAQRFSRQGGSALFLRQDVADEASWTKTVSAVLKRFGKLHILVNNAGTIARQGIVDTTVEAWNRTLAVNLTGAMLGMKHCAPAIRDSGGGSIINISSAAGLTAHDDAAYTGRLYRKQIPQANGGCGA